MILYTCPQEYIACAPARDYAAKIVRIDAVIEALELNMINLVSNSSYTEYSLDDGQTKMRAVYRDTSQVLKDIKGLETLRNYYLSKLRGGRVGQLMDSKNFLPRR